MVATISEYSQRPLRAFIADGLCDIVAGLYFLCLALITYNIIVMNVAVQHASSPQEALAIVWPSVLGIIAICMLPPIGGIAVGLLKARFVYPRTGFVSPWKQTDYRKPRPVVEGVMAALGPGLFSYLAFLWMVRSTSPHSVLQFLASNMALIGMGTMFAAIFGIISLRFGFRRYLIVAGISIATSILLGSAHLDHQCYYFFWWLILGISLITVGADAFMKILRIPVATEHDVE